MIEKVAAHLDDRDALDGVIEEAMRAAKAHVAADDGTTGHRFTQADDAGLPYIQTDLAKLMIGTWRAALEAGGFEVVEGMIERVAVHPSHKICGTFDRIIRRKSDGRLFIADLKTGQKALNYPHAIAVQLAVYANAPLLAGPLNFTGETHEFEPFPDVDKDVGIVIHMPTAEAAELVEFDIAAGWECFANVIVPTMAWRDRGDLCRPLSKIVQPVDAGSGNTPESVESALAAPGAHGVSTPPAAHLDRDALIGRIRALVEAGHGEALTFAWPAGVPGLAVEGHTLHQLELIHLAVTRIEDDRVGFLHTDVQPAPVAPVPAQPQRIEPPFEGLIVEEQTAEVLIRWLAGFSDENQERLHHVATQAFNANLPISFSMLRSVRRYEICRALGGFIEAGWDEDCVRALLAIAVGNDDVLQPAIPLGAAIGALTIDQATHLAAMAHAIGTDALVLDITDGGIRASGPATVAA